MAAPEQVQGRSLCHLLAADADHHEAVLYGGFGKDVCLTDGRYRYFRQALPDSWVHHHTMMPRGSQDFLAVNRLQMEYGYFLKYRRGETSDRGYPQLRWRQPSEAALDSTGSADFDDAPLINLLFDGKTDPGQQRPLRDTVVEKRLAALLRNRLTAVRSRPTAVALWWQDVAPAATDPGAGSRRLFDLMRPENARIPSVPRHPP